MDRVKTRLKILPTLLRLFVGIIGAGGLFLLVSLFMALIAKPSTLLFVMIVVYSTLTFLSLGLGLFSIKTFQVDNMGITERFLWGLIVRKVPLSEIENYKCHMTSNRLGSFEELIVNQKTGDTIFIQAFDQNGFEELKMRVSDLVTEDSRIKPNYWTKFYKIICVMLLIWYGLLSGLAVFRL